MPRLIEIVCSLVSIKFQTAANDWCKLLIRHDSEFKTAVGTIDAKELKLRHDYVMHGYWEHHETYGTQFRFTSMTESAPISYQGVINYLQEARGLGLARAKQIWSKYQDKSLLTVRTLPHAIAATCNVGVDQATEWADYFTGRVRDERFNQELMGLLVGHGFQYEKLKKALLQRWGIAAVDEIKKDPYHMLGMPSAGWMRTDALYMHLQKPPHRLKRQALCAYFNLMKDQSGHTWLPEWAGEQAIMQKVGGTSLRTVTALNLCYRAKLLERWQAPDGAFYVADRDRAEWERRVAYNILRLHKQKPRWLEWLNKSDLDVLYDCQRPQVLEALAKHPVFLLTGPPGTGKSFVLSQICKAIRKQLGTDNICVVALAGKAAVRCTELLNKAGVMLRGSTIHSRMGVDFHDGEYNFDHKREKPLEERVFIIDEISMLDSTLLGKFLDAIPEGGHLIMVGDENQLEPVGSGAPLRDMIAAGVPHVKLTEIQRFEGTIVRACHSMVNGGPIITDDQIRIDTKPPQNMKLIYADPNTMAKQLSDLLLKIRDAGVHHPVWDVQVMVAVNETSPVSRKAMNAMIQNILNPDGYQVEGNPFRVGDKVMNLKNGVFTDDDDENRKWYIANGEFGRVIEVEPRRSVVEFDGKYVMVPHGKLAKTDDDDDAPDKPSIDLAYACTVHKMQGSQTPIAIVVLDEYGGASGPKGLCGKAWLYTAISRAQDLCFLLGKQTTALSMMRKSGLQDRRTRLVEYLAELKEVSHAHEVA